MNKFVGTHLATEATTAKNLASSKLEETGVTGKVKDGVGFVR